MQKMIVLFLLLMFLTLQLPKEHEGQATATYNSYGVIRATDTGKWVLLSNSTHAAKNIVSVTQNDSSIVVTFKPKYVKVHYTTTTPDETLVVNDYNVGASIGLNTATIYIAKSGQKVNPNQVKMPGANIWFYVEGEI